MSEPNKTVRSEDLERATSQKAQSFSLGAVRFFCITLMVVLTFFGEYHFIPPTACAVYFLSTAAETWYLAIRKKKCGLWISAIGSTATFVLFTLLLIRSVLLYA